MTERERLSFDDVEILRLESAAIAGHTMKVIVLEPGTGPLAAEELRRHVEPRLRTEPRARRRVALAPLRLAPPVWVDDPEFVLADHVRARPGGEGLDDAGLRRVAGEIMAERLDPGRPLWALDVVGPLADGRTAIVARIHHAMADGIGCMRFLDAVLWSVEPGPDEAWEPASPPGGFELAVEATRHRLASIPTASIELGRVVASPSRWVATGRSFAALPAVLWRELRPGAADPELDRPLGRAREVAFADVSLADLKAIGHSRPGHVTVNDVLLAAVAGGLRRWLAHGVDDAGLRAQVPVSLHHRDERPGEIGNRDSFLNVELPVAEPDPLRRLELINAATAERKLDGDPDELYDFFHALSRLRPIYRAASRLSSGAREFALSISNVPGPRDPLRVAGRAVERLSTVAEPAPHHVLRVSAISNAGRVSIGLCADPDELAGVDRLADAIEESIAELRAATSA